MVVLLCSLWRNSAEEERNEDLTEKRAIRKERICTKSILWTFCCVLCGVTRPRRRETKTSLNSGPGGRRDDGSLSMHRHSAAANAAETVTRELVCVATRAGADRINWMLVDGRMPTTNSARSC